MKFNLVLIPLMICLGYEALGQEYSGSIRLDRIKKGFNLNGSDKSEMNFKLNHDTIPTVTLDGNEFEFIASRSKTSFDTIVMRSNESQSKLIRIKGGYQKLDGTKYTFNECKIGEWIRCGGIENNSNYIKGSYQVNGNKSTIKVQIHSGLKDKEIVVFMISRLIFESSLIYNLMSGKVENVARESDTFWLINLTGNM